MTELTKPRLPRGLADRGPADLAATARITAAIRDTYELYGFEAVETPFIEYTDALGKFLPDLDRPNAGVFSFKDDDDQWLSLRYDLTAPLARSVAEHLRRAARSPTAPTAPARCSATRSPGRGASASSCSSTADTVGSGLGGGRRRDVRHGGRHAGTARHRAARLRREGERPQGAGRRHGGHRPGRAGGSRPPPRGAARPSTSSTGWAPPASKRCSAPAAATNRATSPRGPACPPRASPACSASRRRGARAPRTRSATFGTRWRARPRGEEGVAELAEIAALVEAAGRSDCVVIDPSVVRGLEYYTGPVFEAELLFTRHVRGRAADPLRLGRRRRPLRRARGALPRRARARHGLLGRRVAPRRGAEGRAQPPRRHGRAARPRRGGGAGSRRDGPLRPAS